MQSSFSSTTPNGFAQSSQAGGIERDSHTRERAWPNKWPSHTHTRPVPTPCPALLHGWSFGRSCSPAAKEYKPGRGPAADVHSALLFAPHGLNNPSRYTDPSGHRICDRPDSKECLSDPGDYGISFDGDYSSHERSFIKRAVEDVAYAIWAESDFETPWEAFQSVYKNLTFGKCGQGNYKSYSCSAFGWTLGRSTILFGGFYKSIERNVRLTVHELAHAFDHYVCQTSGVCDESDMGVGSARHDLQGKLHGCTPTVADGSDCLGVWRV